LIESVPDGKAGLRKYGVSLLGQRTSCGAAWPLRHRYDRLATRLVSTCRSIVLDVCIVYGR
jgi:hypothetical protein